MTRLTKKQVKHLTFLAAALKNTDTFDMRVVAHGDLDNENRIKKTRKLDYEHACKTPACVWGHGQAIMKRNMNGTPGFYPESETSFKEYFGVKTEELFTQMIEPEVSNGQPFDFTKKIGITGKQAAKMIEYFIASDGHAVKWPKLTPTQQKKQDSNEA